VLALTEITYTSLRRRLTVVLDHVGTEHEFVIVRRRGKKGVAMIPADELTGLIETMHLLRSPRNSRRLFNALSRVPAGKDRGRNSSPGRR
jgi:antitoxin YefM